MELNGNEKGYEEIIKENIKIARLLNSVPKEHHEELLLLLQQKEEIMKKNSIFASIKLNIINKKIKKIKG